MLSRAQQIAQPLEQIAAWVPGLQMSREENGAFGNKVSAQQEMGTQQSSGGELRTVLKMQSHTPWRAGVFTCQQPARTEHRCQCFYETWKVPDTGHLGETILCARLCSTVILFILLMTMFWNLCVCVWGGQATSGIEPRTSHKEGGKCSIVQLHPQPLSSF